MAKKKHRKLVAKKRAKSKLKGKRKASKKRGIGTKKGIGSMILTAAALRAFSGLAFWGARKAVEQDNKKTPAQVDDLLSKIKIAVPLSVAFLNEKKMIPVRLDGLTEMAVNQTVMQTVETFSSLKDIFDFRFMDKKGMGALTPRTAAETARLLSGMAYSRGELVSPYSPSVVSLAGTPYARSGNVSPLAMKRPGILAGTYKR